MKSPLIFAGMEKAVSRKSGKEYAIVRVMEIGTGRQMEFMILEEKEIKEYEKLGEFAKVELTIKLDKDKEGNLKAYLKGLKKIA